MGAGNIPKIGGKGEFCFGSFQAGADVMFVQRKPRRVD
jgi:hypothetical protein